MRYWEDFAVGDVTELGFVDVTEREIVEFAQRYDPQPFHVDPAAARRILIYQLMWCLDYNKTTPRHRADTARLCRVLGVETH